MADGITIDETIGTITLSMTGATITSVNEEAAISLDGDAAEIVVSESSVQIISETSIVATVVRDEVARVVTIAEQGPPGVDAVGQRSFPFAWGDATPSLLMTVNAGQMVLGVTLSIDVPFNGVGASLSIGDAADNGRLLDANMVDPTIVGAFQNAPCLRYSSNTQLFVTITPGTGASAGSGVVSLFLE